MVMHRKLYNFGLYCVPNTRLHHLTTFIDMYPRQSYILWDCQGVKPDERLLNLTGQG